MVLLFLAGCSSLPRNTFTEREQALAQIPGIPDARYWADGRP
jgi:hypothetical protein